MLALSGGSPVRDKAFPDWPVYDHTDEQAILSVIRSGQWGLGGKQNEAFEKAFASFHDAKYGTVVTSGTVALYVAMLALGVGPGDEVIIPAYTFGATAAAVLFTGAIPVIVDIDPETYLLDPDATEKAITPKTRCIIPVHVAGNPADMDRFEEISTKHNVPILEDAAQAHGATWNGKGVGSIGTVGTFSFQATKNLNAGEGGIILSNDADITALCRAYRNCGRIDSGAKHLGPVLGWNFRMTELQSALLLSQMQRLEDQINRREDSALYLAERMNQEFGGSDGHIVPTKRDDRVTRHAYHLFMFQFKEDAWGLSLDRFLQGLLAEGIPCSRGYVPLYRDPAFVTSGPSCAPSWPGLPNDWASRDYKGMYLPHAERASSETVWLPQTVLLGDNSDMDDIVLSISKLWKHRKELAELDVDGGSVTYAGLDGS